MSSDCALFLKQQRTARGRPETQHRNGGAFKRTIRRVLFSNMYKAYARSSWTGKTLNERSLIHSVRSRAVDAFTVQDPRASFTASRRH